MTGKTTTTTTTTTKRHHQCASIILVANRILNMATTTTKKLIKYIPLLVLHKFNVNICELFKRDRNTLVISVEISNITLERTIATAIIYSPLLSSVLVVVEQTANTTAEPVMSTCASHAFVRLSSDMFLSTCCVDYCCRPFNLISFTFHF